MDFLNPLVSRPFVCVVFMKARVSGIGVYEVQRIELTLCFDSSLYIESLVT